MPHVHATVPFDSVEGRKALKAHKEDIVRTIAEFSPYRREDILLETKILTAEETELSVNLVPLALVVDFGTCSDTSIDDLYAGTLLRVLINRCDKLRAINFVLWIKRHRDNGFAEHKP